MYRFRGKYESNQSKKTWVKITAFLCFLILFVFSALKIMTTVIENQKAENSYSQLQADVRHEEYANPQQNNSINFSSLKKINPDIIGWLRAEGTNIDYPIVKTDNNEFYLNHLFNKELNSSGAIFADYRNTGDFNERNTVIYGHYMKNGTMFQTLEEYKDQEFYDLNPTMTLFTPDRDYMVELICGTVEDGNYQFVEFEFDDEESFFEYIEGFHARSTFSTNVEIQPGDKIVSLCTCSYERSNARFMVIGRLVPIMER